MPAVGAPDPDHRCTGTFDDRRCQLRHHDAKIPHAAMSAGEKQATRWTDDGETWRDAGGPFGAVTAVRLKWAALGYD